MIKAILYDLDGVLVDATEWHYESLNAALKEICGFVIKREEHISTFNGIPTMKKLEILNNQGRLDRKLFDKIWEKKQEKTFEVIEKSALTDPSKIRLHEQTKNFKKVCVTNSIRKSALLMLEKTGQLQYMDFVISNEDVSSPKPSPEGYKIAIEREQKRTSLSEAVITGICEIGGNPAVLIVFDFGFMGGSVGCVVGEKITLAIERAIRLNVPVIAVVTSSGSRIEEGILSIMQMAKISMAIDNLENKDTLYFMIFKRHL